MQGAVGGSMETVVLLKGASQYGALRLHIDQMADAARAAGFNTVVVDFNESDWHEVINAIPRPVRLIFSVSILGEAKLDGHSIAEILQGPHVVLHVDHPGWHRPRFEDTPPATTILTLDDTHRDFILRLFGPNRFRGVHLLPPGACRATPPQDADADDFVRRRDIPVLFTGSFRGVPQPQWRQMASSPMVDLFKAAMEAGFEIANADDTLCAEAALDMACDVIGLDHDHPLRREIFLQSFYLSEHMHGVRRYAALCALADAGAPVHVYGNGFDGHMGRFKSFVYGGVGSARETLSLIQRARVVLNTNTHFVGGAHERTFAAMAGGAAVVSDTSTYYQRTFKDGQDLLLFSWQRSADVAERVQALLADPARAYAIGCSGRAAVEAGHMWSHRLRDMLGLTADAARTENAP